MPPAIRPQHPRRQRLKRTQWRNLDARLARERDCFLTPLNDLSYNERDTRVRILMNTAYLMGRRDQRDATALRRAGSVTITVRPPSKPHCGDCDGKFGPAFGSQAATCKCGD